MNLRGAGVALALGCLPGCAWLQGVNEKQLAKTRRVALENVAKGWCQTIRASQVIPVYPLTEDLQPGDVFLVSIPIERQHEDYEKRGFLALDNHLARLDPSGYDAFYDTSFRRSNGEPLASLPGAWSRPDGTQAWSAAPHAAFPSYSFSVKGGAGFNLALPVSGVPVGLSLLGTHSAAGTITIADCRTIGVDIVSLWKDLETWRAANAPQLARYASSGERRQYLRVLTRVYLTGRLDVALADTSSVSGGLDAGAPRPVDLLLTDTPEDATSATAARENYTSGIEKINAMLAAQSAPGASLRLNSASARAVALSDTFDPPLVIGYLGFDCEIRPGGALSDPVPTLVTLGEDAAFVEGLFRASPEASIHSATLFKGLRGLIRDALDAEDELPGDLREEGARTLALFDALGTHVDRRRQIYVPEVRDGELVLRETTFGDADPASPPEPDHDGFLRYRAALEGSHDLLAQHLEQEEFALAEGDALRAVRPGDPDDAVAARLRAERDELAALLGDPPWRADEEDARRAALTWLFEAAR